MLVFNTSCLMLIMNHLVLHFKLMFPVEVYWEEPVFE